jgi:hypothetical protein
MAITKELTGAVPYLLNGVVTDWEVTMTYTNGVSGDEQYYVAEYTNMISHDDDTYGFGLSAESDWNTRSQLLALCPIDSWDLIFDSQVESTFNPVAQPAADDSYVLPTED